MEPLINRPTRNHRKSKKGRQSIVDRLNRKKKASWVKSRGYNPEDNYYW